MKWPLACVVFALPALAEPDLKQCADVYSDCHDSCSLKFGTSMAEKDRLKLGKCLITCQKTEQDCRDNYLQTHVHGLDEGALKGVKSHDDDVREDNQKHDIVPEPAKEKPAEAKPAEAKPSDPKPAEAKPAEAKSSDAKKEPEKKADDKKTATSTSPEAKPKSKAQKALDDWDPEAN